LTVKELLDKILNMFEKYDPDPDLWKAPPMPKYDGEGGDYITDMLLRREEQGDAVRDAFQTVISAIGKLEVK